MQNSGNPVSQNNARKITPTRRQGITGRGCSRRTRIKDCDDIHDEQKDIVWDEYNQNRAEETGTEEKYMICLELKERARVMTHENRWRGTQSSLAADLTIRTYPNLRATLRFPQQRMQPRSSRDVPILKRISKI